MTLEYVMSILRGHASESYKPWRGSMRDVCMHFRGLLRPTQTVSSQVSILSNGLSIHWFTRTPIPCLSLFKPFILHDETEKMLKEIMGETSTNVFNARNYWWLVESLHRRLQLNYGKETRDFVDEIR